MNGYSRIVTFAFSPVIVFGAAAQEPVATETDVGIVALLQEHEESSLGYVSAYETFRPRFIQFAEDHLGTEAEARAVLWLIQQAWWLRQEGTMESTAFPLAVDLLERHSPSPQLGLLVEYQYVFKRDQRAELFARLLEESPHRQVQAAAHFGLARLEPVRSDSGDPNVHFSALLDEYTDESWRLTTFGAIADAYVNPHPTEALAIGTQAPEIAGINHEGKPMQLSDYRGKVVLLDFWGHW